MFFLAAYLAFYGFEMARQEGEPDDFSVWNDGYFQCRLPGRNGYRLAAFGRMVRFDVSANGSGTLSHRLQKQHEFADDEHHHRVKN